MLNLQGVVYSLERHLYSTHIVTHTDTFGDMLSILFLAAAVTTMVVSTNYSALSKDAVAAAEEKLHGSCLCVCVLYVHRYTFSTCACVFRYTWHKWEQAKIVFMKLVSFILDLVEAAGGIRSWKYPNTGKSLWLMMEWGKWFWLALITLLLKQETGNWDHLIQNVSALFFSLCVANAILIASEYQNDAMSIKKHLSHWNLF